MLCPRRRTACAPIHVVRRCAVVLVGLKYLEVVQLALHPTLKHECTSKRKR